MVKKPLYSKTDEKLLDEVLGVCEAMASRLSDLEKQLVSKSEIPLEKIREAYQTYCAMTSLVGKGREYLKELLVRRSMKK